MKRIVTCLLSILLLLSANVLAEDNNSSLKPRLVVMTDIGDCDVEPDDMESAIRLMAYADMFEIEAIMTTVGWNCDPYPEEWAQYLDKVVEAYGKDVHNLMARSRQKEFLSLDKENGKQPIGYWPSMEYVKSRCMAGSHKAGIGVIGKDNDTEGSEFLIKLADEDDDRPIWVATWGSGNTLAQAIWKVQQTRTPKQLKAFLNKFRVYTITDQDMVYAMRMNRAYSSHQWMRREFKDDLKFIWDEGTWQLQCELGKQEWKRHQEMIQGHGELGKIYPSYKWGVEGDTPSFLYIMPNGLNDPEDPTQAGWAGCHKFGMCADSITYAWTSWQEPQKSITEGYKRRFYPAELNDFCARMQWAKESRGNTNPRILINNQFSLAPIRMRVKAGDKAVFSALAFDAEGDSWTINWWVQPEASTYQGEVNINHSPMDAATGFIASVDVPKDAKGKTIHVVCEVKDNGEIPLTSYARVILDVK